MENEKREGDNMFMGTSIGEGFVHRAWSYFPEKVVWESGM
jgi:hypothetical protein